ncbi:MAG: ATP-binding protein [Ginsengibacter sp.]
MSLILVGRKEEQEMLYSALASKEAELVAVFGRRRVGKTYLIRQTYQPHIAFELTGLQNSDTAGQLQNFTIQLHTFFKRSVPKKAPSDWLEAFSMLAGLLDRKPSKKKRVIFFDEVPWMAGHKSKFLMAFSWFWNSWAVTRNIVVVICGSAASWMIQKIVKDRGGLHNRITKRIFLYPFTLKETESFLRSRNIFFNHYQIVQLYMAIGGVPHYLKEIKGDKSATQNINDICFSKNSLLRNEFPDLYPSLFSNAGNHIAVVRALAKSRQGLTRQAIVANGKLPEGGNTSKVLEELEQSGFINSYYPFGKQKKDKLYRLTDEYSLFYLRFIERHKDEGRKTWNHLSQTQTAKAWAGYAFENACLKHLPQIKKTLGIAGVYAQSSTFLQKGNDSEKGTQIDLVLDRNDQTINLFEIKFYHSEFVLTQTEANALRNLMSVFEIKTGTKKRLLLTLITTFGIKHNKHSLGLIDQTLTMDDLFL